LDQNLDIESGMKSIPGPRTAIDGELEPETVMYAKSEIQVTGAANGNVKINTGIFPIHDQCYSESI
jgi:hypothetical protein